MKRIAQFTVMILLAIAFTACATGAKFNEVNPDLVAENPDMGRIFFYRPSAIGAALQPDVMIN